jgi:hypothetical protein
MKIAQILEALKPSEYRPLVKGWDKTRYASIFTNPKYKHDKNGYRVFIPIQSATVSRASRIQKEIEDSIQQSGFEIVDYTKGIAQKKDTKQNIKIGKLLTKLKQQELLAKFNTDKAREGTQKEYMVVISRHPYDIGGMSTDRGWTTCMNLKNGMMKNYVPLDVKAGTVVAYVTDKNDPDLKNPTGRVAIKPFVDILGSPHIEFGIEDKMYGTNVPGFAKAITKWVDEVNSQNKLDNVVILKLDPRLYPDSDVPVTRIKGGSEEDRQLMQSILKNPDNIANYKNPPIKLQMQVVKKNGTSIQYIENPPPEVQMAAVMNDGWALGGIKNPSTEIEEAALEKNGNAIKFIKNPTPEQQLAACEDAGGAIRWIKNPTLKMQLAAVNEYGMVIEYIKNPPPEVQMAAVKSSFAAIQYIENPAPEVQLYAVKSNGVAIRYIKNPTDEVEAFMQKRYGKNWRK